MKRGALAAFAALPTIAHAQDIIVTGRGLADSASERVFAPVTIAAERLRDNASGRLEDVLGDVAGFQSFRRVDSRAANPTSQGATLRAIGGNAASRALVTLDGVPLADPFTGFVPFSAIAPEALGRVVVTRGGGAGPFGAGAVTGIVALESGRVPGFARADIGSRSAVRLGSGGTVALGPGKWSGELSADAGYERGAGYYLIAPAQRGAVDVPARYAAWHVAARATIAAGARTEVQAALRLFDDHRLRGQAGTASQSRGGDASVRVIGRGRWQWEALGYVQERGFASGFVATAPDRNSATPTLDQFATPGLGLGGKVELRPPIAGHELRIGGDIRHASGETHERFRFVAGVPTRLRRAGGAEVSGGLFVEDSVAVGRVLLSGGARLDAWRIMHGSRVERDVTGLVTQQASYGPRSGLLPTARGGAAWRVSPALTLRGAAYLGWRLPTLNELYRPFRVGADATAANDALRPERSAGVEAGADWTPAHGVAVHVTGYRDRLRDAIANVTLGIGPGTFDQVGVVAAGGVFRQRRNVAAIRATGIEADVALHTGGWALTASGTHSHVRVVAPGTALDGKPAAQSPAWQASATLSHRAGERTASLSARYQGAAFEDDVGARALPSALTFDGFVTLPLGRSIAVVARVENIADAKVVSGVSATGIEDLGTPRTAWLGISVRR